MTKIAIQPPAAPPGPPGHLPGLVKEYLELLEVRQETERVAEELKKQEKAVKADILSYLSQTGQKGASLPGLGTVTRTLRNTVFIKDGEAACRFMFENMKKAEAAGTPIINHLILQQRASQNKLLNWAEEALKEDGRPPEDFNGLKHVLNSAVFDLTVTEDLHYARARS